MPIEPNAYQSQLGRLSLIMSALQGKPPATSPPPNVAATPWQAPYVQPSALPPGILATTRSDQSPVDAMSTVRSDSGMITTTRTDRFIPSTSASYAGSLPSTRTDVTASPDRYLSGMATGSPAPVVYQPQDTMQPTPPRPAPVSAGTDIQTNPWNRRWTENDVRYLARAISAEARGEISKFIETGDRSYRDSAVGIGYVIARTAVDRGESIMNVIQNQPMFLSSYGMGHSSGNSDNFRQFYQDPSRIPNWEKLVDIAREALAGRDPSGVDSNHFYDVSIAHDPPDWARGGQKRQIANIIFVQSRG